MIDDQPGGGGGQEADAVRHRLRIEGAGRAEGEGQQAGGAEIQGLPEKGQGQGELRKAEGRQRVHKGILEA